MNYKHSFFNDYSEGGHPAVLNALQETNMSQQAGYGLDDYCMEAAELIKAKTESPNADIHFVSGGTQANLTVLASMLKPYESVIAPMTAHVCVHEAGAIEATGHKINAVPSADGKITPDQIRQVYEGHQDEHMVSPKAVFVSNSTELGTIYTKGELQSISKTCKELNLYLHLDGARIGTALVAEGNDLGLSDVSRLVDVFYIGGTKSGALFGECIVINNEALKKDFRRNMKQRGALLAKGRVMGIQFLELFKSDLYFELSRHANDVAMKLVGGIRELGYGFLADSVTNQIFPIFPNSIIEKLQNDYGFYVWTKLDDEKSSIRLVTSWATPQSAVEMFLEDLRNITER